MDIRSVCKVLDEAFPPQYQESYDNSGIQIGDPSIKIRGTLLCLDVTEDVLDEAIQHDCNLIVSHHPLLFHSLKSITGANYVERVVMRALKHDIVIYAAHTSADNVMPGINSILGECLELQNVSPLAPIEGQLLKLTVFLPQDFLPAMEQALWRVGAGKIGAYDNCSFVVKGDGSFRAGEAANPFVGTLNKLHRGAEVALSVILPRHLRRTVEDALRRSHPYEEPAYEFISVENEWLTQGGGLVGDLPRPLEKEEFLRMLSEKLPAEQLSYNNCLNKTIRRVALVGGAGGSYWRKAAQLKADAFLTGEARYNDYSDAESSLLLISAGHFETEYMAVELFRRTLLDKIPNFAFRISTRMRNPVNYYKEYKQ